MVTHLSHRGSLVFDAVADPTRRAILDRLAAGSRPAGAIAEAYQVSRPAISKHLRVLERAGLVRVIRHGRHRIYELTPEPLRELDAWVARYRLFWAARLTGIKSLAEAIERDPDRTPGAEPPQDSAPLKGPERRGRQPKETP